jgi:hypothetical protein
MPDVVELAYETCEWAPTRLTANLYEGYSPGAAAPQASNTRRIIRVIL